MIPCPRCGRGVEVQTTLQPRLLSSVDERGARRNVAVLTVHRDGLRQHLAGCLG